MGIKVVCMVNTESDPIHMEIQNIMLFFFSFSFGLTTWLMKSARKFSCNVIEKKKKFFFKFFFVMLFFKRKLLRKF